MTGYEIPPFSSSVDRCHKRSTTTSAFGTVRRCAREAGHDGPHATPTGDEFLEVWEADR